MSSLGPVAKNFNVTDANIGGSIVALLLVAALMYLAFFAALWTLAPPAVLDADGKVDAKKVAAQSGILLGISVAFFFLVSLIGGITASSFYKSQSSGSSFDSCYRPVAKSPACGKKPTRRSCSPVLNPSPVSGCRPCE